MTQLFTSKKTPWILLALVVLVLVSLSVSQFLIAQEETEEEQECKWHVINLSVSERLDWRVNAIMWESCAGEAKHLVNSDVSQYRTTVRDLN